jgi:hypothetical protein
MSEKQGKNNVDRSQAVLIKGKIQTSDYVDAPPARRVALVWELTEELWSITGRTDAQRRLQRDVATLKKQ